MIMINGRGGPRRLRVWLYRANGGPSPIKGELAKLGRDPQSAVLNAFKGIATRNDPPPHSESTRGQVACFRVPHGQPCIYIFCALLVYRSTLVVLHVVADGSTGPPEPAYELAQDRLQLAPL